MKILDDAEVRKLLRASCDEIGGQAKWAKKNSLSPPYISDVLAGRRDPGPSILLALGLERDVTYRKVKK